MSETVQEIIARANRIAWDESPSKFEPIDTGNVDQVRTYAAAQIVAALDAAGFVIVPKEPTDSMGFMGLKVRSTPYASDQPEHLNPILSEDEKVRFNWAADILAAARWMKPIYRDMIAARPK